MVRWGEEGILFTNVKKDKEDRGILRGKLRETSCPSVVKKDSVDMS
jgi:hypothetical protein